MKRGPGWNLEPVPMTPEACLAKVIAPAAFLLPCYMDTPQARLIALAIIGQESNFQYRKQIGGPAKGLGQFEKMGGVWAVLNHSTTAHLARYALELFGVPPNVADAYNALEKNDILGAIFIRLNLYRDPMPLPAIGNEAGAWEFYRRVWAPGQPHPARWPRNYERAFAAVVATLDEFKV